MAPVMPEPVFRKEWGKFNISEIVCQVDNLQSEEGTTQMACVVQKLPAQGQAEEVNEEHSLQSLRERHEKFG